MSKLNDLTGNVFGEITVISRSENTKNGSATWLCSCVCGAIKIIPAVRLSHGKVKSCGCSKSRLISEAVSRHGHHKLRTCSKTLNSWRGMKSRCLNKNNKRFDDYGGRGITVCEEWLTFERFLDDMGERPEGLTLDRIDVNGNYCKENCRWATNTEQSANRRTRKDNKSGKTGVRKRKNGKKFEVSIRVDGKNIRFGSYSDYELAVFVREEVEIKYHGAIQE